MSVQQTCQELGWTLESVDVTESTNADLVGRAHTGVVLIAAEQTAGRGRLDRQWVSAPGDGLTFSVRLHVPATVTAWGWIPLLAGVATADAVRGTGASGIGLKWPNDVVGQSGKLAGILSARDGDAAIIGIGLNVAFSGERPDPHAVSVAECGGNPDGEAILEHLLRSLHGWWERFVASGGDAQRCGLTQAYVEQCVSVGVDVDVHAPDRTWSGRAEGIDDEGRLVVREADDLVAVSAGDVTLR